MDKQQQYSWQPSLTWFLWCNHDDNARCDGFDKSSLLRLICCFSFPGRLFQNIYQPHPCNSNEPRSTEELWQSLQLSCTKCEKCDNLCNYHVPNLSRNEENLQKRGSESSEERREQEARTIIKTITTTIIITIIIIIIMITSSPPSSPSSSSSSSWL